MKKIILLINHISLIIRSIFLKKCKISILSKTSTGTILSGKNWIHRWVNVKDSYIGYATFIGPNTKLEKVYVGNYSSIANNVSIIGDNHPIHTFVSTHSAFYKPHRLTLSFVEEAPKGINFKKVANDKYDVIIGNDVWIGQDVRIMKGVKIADGSVIGAGAIVTKDTDPFSINVGIPSKKIKSRFLENEIETLKKLKWWDWDENTIRDRIDFFMNIENFLELNSSILKEKKNEE